MRPRSRRWTACAAGAPRSSAPRSLPCSRLREKVNPAMADWRANLVVDDAGLTAILREGRTVAVLGAKADPSEAAHYVPAYLREHGYRIRPVNPRFAGQRLHDAVTVAGLDALSEEVARAGIRVVQDRCMMPEHRRLIAAKGVRA